MTAITKVLVANRGEIAVRVARACRDSGIGSVAVYADSDRDALHVRVADEAYALHGQTSAETYLVVDKLLDIAARSQADAVHPGYGFLAENAAFAQAVINAGLVWVGPPPAAIDALGDKVSARHIAQRAGAPLVAGTADPVAGVDEVVTFAEEHGLPIAIKAAFGGGGRGLKVARYDGRDPASCSTPQSGKRSQRSAAVSASSSATSIGRGTSRPSAWPTSTAAWSSFPPATALCNAGTRSWSRRRLRRSSRTQQNAQLYAASKAILKEAGYVGAGTCEFLVGQDGTISFLEVNTRLQVEHPVTEEVTGIDLVREMFRIAAGEQLGYDDPPIRGHSIEFRINGEDPGRNFLPTPGPVTVFRPPSGPGVRLDAGVEAGQRGRTELRLPLGEADRDRIRPATGAGTVPPRARRVRGAGPGHGDPVPPGGGRRSGLRSRPTRQTPFAVHTRWIETEFDNRIPPYTGGGLPARLRRGRESVVVEVGGKRFEVSLPAGLGTAGRGFRSRRQGLHRHDVRRAAGLVMSPAATR